MPCHVYILANRTRVLYVGVTSDLSTRLTQHREHVVRGFTQHYNVDRLVYVEAHERPIAAIRREKQIKGLSRAKKIAIDRARQSAVARPLQRPVAAVIPSAARNRSRPTAVSQSADGQRSFVAVAPLDDARVLSLLWMTRGLIAPLAYGSFTARAWTAILRR